MDTPKPRIEEEFFEEKMFCHHCDDSLAGHRYVLRDDHPYCIKCYENVFANNCDECGKIIGIDSKVSPFEVPNPLNPTQYPFETGS